MKKILVVLIGLIIIAPTYATTMCAANDTVAVVLDPSISISGISDDGINGTWKAWSSFGTFYGISACLNHTQHSYHLYDTNNNETKKVVGTERYGRYCWCRLTHPVSSLWFYSPDGNRGEACAYACANVCAYFFRTNVSFRQSMISSAMSN